MSKGRMEAFSDGVFAIAITLLVLELTIGETGTALKRVLEGWPFYLAYIVSFLTIGAAWMAHSSITHRLKHVDPIFLRLNLLLLLFVSLLPFPTRLVAEAMHEIKDERVFVPMYGLILVGIRLMLYVVDEYAFREGLNLETETKKDTVRATIVPLFFAYFGSILVGLLVPSLAVALYCGLAIVLVVPFKQLKHLLFHS